MELCSPGLVCEPLGVWPVQVQNPFLSPLVLVVVLQVLCGLKHERGMWGGGWGWGAGLPGSYAYDKMLVFLGV